MCGLFAAFSRGKKILIDKQNLLDKVNKIMGHRGPDNTGLYINNRKNVLLIHTRLSIQDLSANGNQPFLSKDDSQLIYNGEIYNAKFISKNLDIKNLKSDTNFLSQLLCKNDSSYLKLIEGMYAFVRYCPKQNKIFFGRDYFGEKPLYIFQDDEYTFLFSEIQFLKIAQYFSEINIELDLDSINRFLLYGYRQAFSQDKGISFIRKVREVIPGSFNVFDLNSGCIKMEIINSISKDFYNSKEEKDYSLSNLKQVLIKNITERSISDVPTGVSLSGGIDSNIITAILCKSNNPPEIAFTLNANDKRYSEVPQAELAASYFGIKHVSVDINDLGISPVENFLRLSSQRKVPFLTLTSFVSWYLANAAKNSGIKVMFSGVGGDEFFSGYYDHFFFRQNNNNISEQEIKDFKENMLPNIRNPILSDFKTAGNAINTYSHHYEDLEERLDILNKDQNFLSPYVGIIPNKSQLRIRMFSEITREIIPIILHEDDINYMNCSVENRSPMLSRGIYLESLKIPEKKLFSNGYQKFPLREIAFELIPEELRLNHRKVGFNYSVWDFINSDIDTINSLLDIDSLLWDMVNKFEFKKKFISKNISEKFLFNIFSLQAFLVNFKKDFQ